MSKKIQLTVDGRPAEAGEGVMLLGVLESMGIHVPTLCHHPSLEPSGACRLCIVEITHPDWKGWSGLVTSCLYPVEEGLQVSTRSERVRSARRTLLEMFLARCPGSEEVKALARAEGVDASTFPERERADKGVLKMTFGEVGTFSLLPERELADTCVLCGLCTRVCQDLGPSAIALLDRGSEKTVGPRPDMVGEDCTGCGACALICPTGAIQSEHHNGVLRIWNRTFELPLCRVVPEKCRACGVCEEVCPLAIPRVAAFKTGNLVALISPDQCTGCGICAGACPTGAIAQEGLTPAMLLGGGSPGEAVKDRTVVFACSRSPLPEERSGAVLVPCIGRVSVEAMLENLARGAKGVLVLCRDQATCPSGPGGALAEKRASVAEALAASAGLGEGRVRYVRPRPGPGGPEEALAAFRESLEPSPLEAAYPGGGDEDQGMDRALAVMHWLRTRPELLPSMPGDLDMLFEGSAKDADTLLYLGDLTDLDLLLSLIIKEWRLKSLIEDAWKLLQQKGIQARPVLTAREVRDSKAWRLVAFSREGLPDFGRPVEIVTLDELAGAEPVGAVREGQGTDGLFRFRITHDERQKILAALTASTKARRCASPMELAQCMILLRLGAWQQALSEFPVMAFSGAAFSETAGRRNRETEA